MKLAQQVTIDLNRCALLIAIIFYRNENSTLDKFFFFQIVIF